MNIPFFSFDQRNKDVKEEALKSFENFFNSGWYVLGQNTQEFEQDYATFNDVNYCVGVSSGLDALHLSLKALNIGEGDEVIVPSNTYIASVLAISYTGATPVFVEPRLETANLNPELIEAAITSRTKCIMPVHLYGQACEMDAIMHIANKHNLFVVEDNAQAHGARYKGKLTGSFGDINATSFYPTKNIGALGEAGAVTTNSKDLAEKVKVLRNYGSEKRYYNKVIGYNNRIDEFEAAYLKVALNHIEEWTKQREQIAELYKSKLSSLKGIKPIEIAEGATSVNHLFVIRTKKRDSLKEYLNENGIGTQIHYPIPPYLQEAYKELNYKKGDLPIAEELSDTVLSLPLWPGLKEQEVQMVWELIENFEK